MGIRERLGNNQPMAMQQLIIYPVYSRLEIAPTAECPLTAAVFSQKGEVGGGGGEIRFNNNIENDATINNKNLKMWHQG